MDLGLVNRRRRMHGLAIVAYQDVLYLNRRERAEEVEHGWLQEVRDPLPLEYVNFPTNPRCANKSYEGSTYRLLIGVEPDSMVLADDCGLRVDQIDNQT
jgi:hypothetical protein